ncbi:MAG TPA: amidase family protein, partial [Xanthobacteraceae bacterium]
LARSAADILLLAPAIAELPRARSIARAALLDDVVAECAPAVRRAARAAAAALSGSAVAVEPCPGLAAIEAADRHALIVLQGESARVHRAYVDEPSLAPPLRRRLGKGLDISDAELAESISTRARLAADFEEQALGANEAAILPMMAILTPDAAECDPGSSRFSPRTVYALSRFTRFVNLLGLPAVALPAGFDDAGMPVGVQLVGRAGSDLALLGLARDLQAGTDWHGRVPDAVSHVL